MHVVHTLGTIFTVLCGLVVSGEQVVVGEVVNSGFCAFLKVAFCGRPVSPSLFLSIIPVCPDDYRIFIITIHVQVTQIETDTWLQ